MVVNSLFHLNGKLFKLTTLNYSRVCKVCDTNPVSRWLIHCTVRHSIAQQFHRINHNSKGLHRQISQIATVIHLLSTSHLFLWRPVAEITYEKWGEYAEEFCWVLLLIFLHYGRDALFLLRDTKDSSSAICSLW